MMRMLLVGAVAAVSLDFVRHDPHPYHIVFDLASQDTLDQKMALRLIDEASSNAKAQVEIVMYGKGYDLVMPERSQYLTQVRALLKRPNLAFRVCAIAMKNGGVEKRQLEAGVETVPDGLFELVSKQQDNWGYIKVKY
ncbi:MAG: DsrE family protein [Gemmatimonadota bacterium]